MTQSLIKSFFEIFKITDLTGTKKVNIFELFIQMIIFAKSDKVLKLKFICILFDFEHRKQITREQLILIVTLLVSGIAKLFTLKCNVKDNSDLVD